MSRVSSYLFLRQVGVRSDDVFPYARGHQGSVTELTEVMALCSGTGSLHLISSHG